MVAVGLQLDCNFNKIGINMKKIILFLVFSSGLFANAANEGFFSQDDKQAHMAVSTLTAGVATLFFEKNGFSESESSWLGWAASMFVGVAKEVYDQKNGGEFDMKDIAADGIGAALGSFVVVKYKF